MGYAYNFNPNYPYQRPQTMAAASVSPYGRPAAPAPYGQPFAPVASSYGRPVTPAYLGGVTAPRFNMPTSGPAAPNGFLAPQPGLPTPSQVLNPTALPGGNPQTGFANNAASIAQKPQIQNHYYTVTSGKEPSSKKKNIKKFLLTTGAVVAGMFTTIGAGIGLIWFFCPSFIQLGKAIGPKNAQAAANALSEWKKPGTILDRLGNAYKAFAKGQAEYAEHQNNSAFNRLKNWFQNLFKSTEQIEAEKAKQAQQEALKKEKTSQAPEAFLEDLVEQASQGLSKISPEKQKQWEAYIADLGSQIAKKTLEQPENQAALKKVMTDAISDQLAGIPIVGPMAQGVGKIFQFIGLGGKTLPKATPLETVVPEASKAALSA